MEEIFGRLVLQDRVLPITKPITYFGKSGSEFDGTFNDYIDQYETASSSEIEFLGFSEDPEMPAVAARLSFDYLSL